MALPMKAVQYTAPISLTPKGEDIRVPNLQTRPPAQPHLKTFQSNLVFPRVAMGITALVAVIWVAGTPIGFNFMTILQLGSIVAAYIGVMIADYYSLPIVKEKHLAQRFKKKIGQEKRKKRSFVNELIRKMQRIPKADAEVQKKFYHHQGQILQEERSKIDKIVGAYRQNIAQKDQQVLKLNQTELEEVQALEKKLTKEINLDVVEGLSYLPLPEKVIWLNQRLSQPNRNDDADFIQQLTLLRDELSQANEYFEEQRQTIAAHFEKEHQSISNEANTAHLAMAEQIQAINQDIQQQKKILFEQIFVQQTTQLEQQNEAIQQIKKEILELEDLYQNFNTVANKLLEYKKISFGNYLKRVLLRQ
jgi:hypothetical protein